MQQLKKNTLISLGALFFQSGYSAVLGLVANIILTIFGGIALFGIYSLTQAALALFNYFSDIGLAGALIQKKEVQPRDLRVVFTLQMFLVTSLVALGFVMGENVMRFYNLDAGVINLYHALLIGFFLSSLKTIPSVLLERSVQFQKIVRISLVENTLFYIIVSGGILLGYGLDSFVAAVLIRAFIGATLMYASAGWNVGFAFDIPRLRELLSFGIPYQSSSLLALFKDDMIILFLGKILGIEALGYVTWAKKWADTPIRIIMDNISKVLFPLFSRIQDDREKLVRIVETSLRFQTLILAPVYTLAIILMPKLIYAIPRYAKWEPGVVLFQILAVSAFLATFSTPFMNLFNSLKRTRIPFLFMLGWTSATWIFVPTLTQLYGNYGFPITQILLSSTCVIVIYFARRLVHFRIVPQITAPLIASVVCATIVFPLSTVISPTLGNITLLALIGALAYGAGVYALTDGAIFREVLSYLPKRFRTAS